MGAQPAVRGGKSPAVGSNQRVVLHPRLASLRPETFTRPARLLLAHPDPDQRLKLSVGLKRREWTIRQFPDAGALLNWLADDIVKNGGPRNSDLIIMDARLPGRKGVRLLADLRAAGWPIPVVILAESGIRNLTCKARTYGNALVFGMPFDMYDLHTAVVYLLDREAGAGSPDGFTRSLRSLSRELALAAAVPPPDSGSSATSGIRGMLR